MDILSSPLTNENEIEHTVNTEHILCRFNENIHYMIFNFIFAQMANRSNCRTRFWISILCMLDLQCYNRMAAQVCYRIEMELKNVYNSANGAKAWRKLFTNPTNARLLRTIEQWCIGAWCEFHQFIQMQVIQMEISKKKKKNIAPLFLNWHSTCFQSA